MTLDSVYFSRNCLLACKRQKKSFLLSIFFEGGGVGGGVRGGEGVESEVIVGFRRVQKR